MRLPLHLMPGTTQKVIISLIVEVSDLAAAWVTFVQGGKIVINKTLEECRGEGKDLIVQLSQEDTLNLVDSVSGEVQVRGRLIADDDVIESEPEAFSTGRCLKREVI